MAHLAQQLEDWSTPTEVIAAASSHQQNIEALTRTFASSAMINPAVDPMLNLGLTRTLQFERLG